MAKKITRDQLNEILGELAGNNSDVRAEIEGAIENLQAMEERLSEIMSEGEEE